MSSGGGGGGPAPRDLYTETAGELRAKRDLAPSVYATEAQYDPMYGGLELSNMHDLLFGTEATSRKLPYSEVIHGFRNIETGAFSETDPFAGMSPTTAALLKASGKLPSWAPWDEQVQRFRTVEVPKQEGYLSMADKASRSADNLAAESATRQRTNNINDYANLGPEALAALKASDPETAKMLDELTRQSQEELQMGTSLDPSQRRLVQQSVREGQAARGMGFGPADNYEEALGVSEFGQEQRQQRRLQASSVIGLRQGIYGDATRQMVSQSGTPYGSDYLSSAYGISHGSGPRLFGSSINANDVADSNFNAANARSIADKNNAAATNAAYVQGGVGLAAAGITAVAIA